jgi:acyl-CoA synthetase (AMP-forming)/AMP-acid ligase II
LHCRTLQELALSYIDDASEWLILPYDPTRSDDAKRFSYGEVLARARSVAAVLSRDLEPDSRVALVLENGVDFCVALLGVFLSANIPAPQPPPNMTSDLAAYQRRLRGALGTSRCTAVLTISSIASIIVPPEGCRVIAVDQVPESYEGEWTPTSRVEARAPALLQQTSGTTGASRGVLLSHSAILSNLASIGAALGASSDEINLCWLPLNHDMGLIGTLLYTMAWNMRLVLMSPETLVLSPASFLWAMSRYGAIGCAAPNFAYHLCTSTKRVPPSAIEGLDLRSWRKALNGAEAVREQTLQAFEARFGPYGFSARAWVPVYGLAENSVAVCFSEVGQGARVDHVDPEELARGRATAASNDDHARTFVSVGRPLPENEIRVVDDTGEEIAERDIGNLQVKGPSMMIRYDDARLQPFTQDGWLDTGDLAYMAAGELHIVGRRKEVIKVAGKGYVAGDIQAEAARLTELRGGSIAAFGISSPDTGTEELVLVAEVRDDVPPERYPPTCSAVVHGIARAFGLSPAAVVLSRRRSLPRTTSGKLRSETVKTMFLEGTLTHLFLWTREARRG